MTTFTKEQLISRINQVTAINKFRISRDPDADGLAMDNELFAIALASLEAEGSGRNPVLAYADSYRDMAKQGIESIPVWSVITDLERNIAPLYTAPPAPVSVADLGALTKCIVQRLVDYGAADDDAIARAEEFVYNSCRAAMLQGAEPVATAYKLPPHVYRELVNSLRDTAVKYHGCQQLREQLSRTMQEVIQPAAPQQEVKS